MTMRNARFILVLIGVLLPYAARLPHGLEWLQQYTNPGLGGWLFLAVFNAIALVLIPIYALLPIAIGGVIGYIVDRRFAAP